MNPYQRHIAVINRYVLKKPGDTKLLQRDVPSDQKVISIPRVIKQNHKFLWEQETPTSWEERLAKKYYDRLFKEYCICDLKLYKTNKVALRWRTEKEVISGKGQFICGNKICTTEEHLRTWEVNFAYRESNEKKNALVKLRLCPPCSEKLNYQTKKREVKRLKAKSFDKKTPEKTKITKATTSSENSKENVDQGPSSENLWAQPIPDFEKTREEEFEEYLEELIF